MTSEQQMRLYVTIQESQNVAVEWLALLLRIPGVPDSNLGPAILTFPQSLQTNAASVL
jgi:hypothetical protein